MFWLFAILSTIGYSLNGVGSVFFARKLDPYSASVYRNLSMGISFLPILFWVSPQEYFQIPLSTLSTILISAIIMVVPTFGGMRIARILTVGVSVGLGSTIKIFFSTIIAWIFFQEILSFTQIGWIIFALVGTVFLSLSKKSRAHLESASYLKKMTLLLIVGLSVSIGFILLAQASRQYNVLITSHIWEFSIGIFGYIALQIRKKMNGQGLQKISLRTFGKILLYCSPTVIGTGCYALASTLGPISILTTIGVSGIAFSSLLGFLLFKEKLTYKEILFMGVIIIGLVGLYLT